MTRKLAPAAAVIVTLAVAPRVSLAQTNTPEVYQQLLNTALDNLAKAQCGAAPCSPATTEERANPPLTDEQVRNAVAAGTVSIFAEQCQLDWRPHFESYMRHHRIGLKMNDRQLALVGLLHGITMGSLTKRVEQTPCTPEFKAGLEKKLFDR